MKRVFIAINLSDSVRRKAAKYIDTLRRVFQQIRVGWIESRNLHITLKFIGETDEENLKKLKDVVEATARKTSNFKLNVCGQGAFPKKERAKVLWLGVDGETNILADLNKRLERRLEKAGFERDAQKFNPHLTIARLREPRASQDLVAAHFSAKFETAKFKVSEIAIYESMPKANGSIYSLISRHQLS